MLKRRAKRRYLVVVHPASVSEIVDTVAKRCSTLFGSVTAEKAAIKLIRCEGNTTIIKCRLEQLDSVLVSIALSEPPMAVVDMSGSMKRLLRRR